MSAVVVVLLVLVGYLAHCRLHPYKDCTCVARGAKGRTYGGPRAHSEHRRCRGTGQLVRVGSRLMGRPRK